MPRPARNSRHSSGPKAKCRSAPALRLPSANWVTGTAIIASSNSATRMKDSRPSSAGPIKVRLLEAKASAIAMKKRCRTR